MADRWSFQDGTTATKGCGRILLDDMDICIDVFPFRKDADPEAVKKNAKAIVETLNSAENWRSGNAAAAARLEDAVDGLPISPALETAVEE